MKTLLFLAALLGCSAPQSSSEEQNSFQQFNNLFDSPQALPASLTAKFIELDSLPYRGVITSVEKRTFGVFTGLVFQVGCDAGGICYSQLICIYDSVGNLVSKAQVAYEYSDDVSSRRMSYQFQDNFILLKEEEVEFGTDQDDIRTEQVISGRSISFQIDTKTGLILRR